VADSGADSVADSVADWNPARRAFVQQVAEAFKRAVSRGNDVAARRLLAELNARMPVAPEVPAKSA